MSQPHYTEQAPKIQELNNGAVLAGADIVRWAAQCGGQFCRVVKWNYKGDNPGKKPIGAAWQNKPLSAGAVIPHLERGGNVGFIAGKHSANIGIIDVDERYQEFCERFGLAGAPAILRDGADKGKIFVYVDGPIPDGKKWRRTDEKAPFFEWLSTGNQGVIAGTHPSGVPYKLVNADEPIFVLTTAELNDLVTAWTGSGFDDENEPPLPAGMKKPEKRAYPDGDGLREAVIERWQPLEVFKHFGRVDKIRWESGGEWLRLFGNGGLFVHKDGDGWNLVGEPGTGGGTFEAWQYCKNGSCKVPKDRQFYELLVEMARAGGLTIPQRVNGNHQAPELQEAPAGDQAEQERKEAINQALLSAAADHDGHARCVILMHGARFAYCEAYGWMYYNGKYWRQEGAEAKIDRAIVKTLKARRVAAVHAENEPLVRVTRANSSNVSGTKALLQSLIFVKVGDFDQNPDLLNCANGVLNLRTGELQAHDPQQRFTYCLPVDYDPGADYAPWVAFLNHATGDPEITEYLKRAVGYSLTGYTWEEVLFYIYGPTRSGKGTFTETLLRVLGNEPLATEADFTTFTAERYGDTQNFDLAPLKPCRFVAASESNKHQPLNPAKIKALTGGNLVRCAFKHRDHFTYRPQFKIWLSSNHRVNVDVDDDAAWARVRVIVFPNSHLGKEDKTLKHRMTTPANLRGVLRWAVDGAREWYALKNGLPLPERIRKEAEDQRGAQDYIAQFLDDKTIDLPQAFVKSSDLWQAYKAWCEANGVPAKYQNQFTASVVAKGKDYKRRRVDGEQARGFEGLGLLV